MVNSILNSKINYPEIKKMDPEDKSFDASMYEIEVLGIDIVIALGQAKYAFINDNIVYYPIYLVKGDRVSKQIGVYEILADQLPNIIDEDGDVDLGRINDPLIYSFVNVEMLNRAKNINVAEKQKQKEEDIEVDKDINKDEPLSDTDEPLLDTDEDDGDFHDLPLPEQSENQIAIEKDNYKKEKEIYVKMKL